MSVSNSIALRLPQVGAINSVPSAARYGGQYFGMLRAEEFLEDAAGRRLSIPDLMHVLADVKRLKGATLMDYSARPGNKPATKCNSRATE